jgi:hypothetical protein
LNYTNWHVLILNGKIKIHRILFEKKTFFRILPGIEYVTVPFSINNITNSSIVCLKIEQNGEKFISSGSWLIDDLLMIRSRLQNEYLFEKFQKMRTTNWYGLASGQLKVMFIFLKTVSLL